MLVFVRFTGTRAGSLWYQARGTNRYAFGQNSSHYQQAIPVKEWPLLKAEFGAWLLEIPVEKARRDMVLHALVAACDLPALDRQTKEALISAGLETLGMVLAEDADRLKKILPNAEAVRRSIAVRVGLEDAPEPTTNVVEATELTEGANVAASDADAPSDAPVVPSDVSAGEGRTLSSKRKRV